jgi:hypothetical protein
MSCRQPIRPGLGVRSSPATVICSSWFRAIIVSLPEKAWLFENYLPEDVVEYFGVRPIGG